MAKDYTIRDKETLLELLDSPSLARNKTSVLNAYAEDHSLSPPNTHTSPQVTEGSVSDVTEPSRRGLDVSESVVPLSHRNRKPFDWLDDAKTTISANAFSTPTKYSSKRTEDTLSNYGMGGKDSTLVGKEITKVLPAGAAGALTAVEGMAKSPKAMMSGYYASKDAYASKRELESSGKALEQAKERSKQYQKEHKAENEKKAEEWAKKADATKLYKEGSSIRKFLDSTKKDIQDIKEETGTQFTLADAAYTIGQMAPAIVLAKGGSAVAGKLFGGTALGQAMAANYATDAALANVGNLPEAAYDIAKAVEVARGIQTAEAVAEAAKIGQTIGSIGTMFAQVYGESFDEARQLNFDAKTASEYALSHALVESGTELLGGGVPGMNEGVATKMFSNLAERTAAKFGSEATASLLPKIATKVGKVLSSPAGEMTLDILGEGVEEMISEWYDGRIARETIDPNAPLATREDILLAGFEGSLVSAMMQSGVRIIKESLSNGVAYAYNENTNRIEKVTAEEVQKQAEAKKAEADEAEATSTPTASKVSSTTTTAEAKTTKSSGTAKEEKSPRESVIPNTAQEAVSKGAPTVSETMDDMSRRTTIRFVNSLLSTASEAAKDAFREGGALYEKYGSKVSSKLLNAFEARAGEFVKPLSENATWDEIEDYMNTVAVPQMQMNVYDTVQTTKAADYRNLVMSPKVDTITVDMISDTMANDYAARNGLTGNLGSIKATLAESINKQLTAAGDNAEAKAEIIKSTSGLVGGIYSSAVNQGPSALKAIYGDNFKQLHDAEARRRLNETTPGRIQHTTKDGYTVMADADTFLKDMAARLGKDSSTLTDAQRTAILEEFKNSVEKSKKDVQNLVADFSKRGSKTWLKVELYTPTDVSEVGDYDADTKTIKIADTTNSVDAVKFYMAHELSHFAFDTLDPSRRTAFQKYIQKMAGDLGVDLKAEAQYVQESDPVRYDTPQKAAEEAYTRFISELLGSSDMLIELAEANPSALDDLIGYIEARKASDPVENKEVRRAENATLADAKAAKAGVLEKREAKRNAPLSSVVPEEIKEAAKVSTETPKTSAETAKERYLGKYDPIYGYHGMLEDWQESLLEQAALKEEDWNGNERDLYWRDTLTAEEREFLEDVDEVIEAEIQDEDMAKLFANVPLAEKLGRLNPEKYEQMESKKAPADSSEPVASSIASEELKPSESMAEAEAKHEAIRAEATAETFASKPSKLTKEMIEDGFQRVPPQKGDKLTLEQVAAGEDASRKAKLRKEASAKEDDDIDTLEVLQIAGLEHVDLRITDVVNNDGTVERRIDAIPRDDGTHTRKGGKLSGFKLNPDEKAILRDLEFKHRGNGDFYHVWDAGFWRGVKNNDPNALKRKGTRRKKTFAEYTGKTGGDGAVFSYIDVAEKDSQGKTVIKEYIKLGFRGRNGRIRGGTEAEKAKYRRMGFEPNSTKDGGNGYYAPFSTGLVEKLGLPATTHFMREQNNIATDNRTQMFVNGGKVPARGEGYVGYQVSVNPTTNTILLWKDGKPAFFAKYDNALLDKILGETGIGTYFQSMSSELKEIKRLRKENRERQRMDNFLSLTAKQEEERNEKLEKLNEEHPESAETLARNAVKEERMRNRKGTVSIKFRNNDEVVTLPIIYTRESEEGGSDAVFNLLKEMTTVTKDGHLKHAGEFWDDLYVDRPGTRKGEEYATYVDAPEVYTDERTGMLRRIPADEIPELITLNDTGEVIWDATNYDETKKRPADDIDKKYLLRTSEVANKAETDYYDRKKVTEEAAKQARKEANRKSRELDEAERKMEKSSKERGGDALLDTEGLSEISAEDKNEKYYAGWDKNDYTFGNQLTNPLSEEEADMQIAEIDSAYSRGEITYEDRIDQIRRIEGRVRRTSNMSPELAEAQRLGNLDAAERAKERGRRRGTAIKDTVGSMSVAEVKKVFTGDSTETAKARILVGKLQKQQKEYKNAGLYDEAKAVDDKLADAIKEFNKLREMDKAERRKASAKTDNKASDKGETKQKTGERKPLTAKEYDAEILDALSKRKAAEEKERQSNLSEKEKNIEAAEKKLNSEEEKLRKLRKDNRKAESDIQFWIDSTRKDKAYTDTLTYSRERSVKDIERRLTELQKANTESLTTEEKRERIKEISRLQTTLKAAKARLDKAKSEKTSKLASLEAETANLEKELKALKKQNAKSESEQEKAVNAARQAYDKLKPKVNKATREQAKEILARIEAIADVESEIDTIYAEDINENTVDITDPSKMVKAGKEALGSDAFLDLLEKKKTVSELEGLHAYYTNKGMTKEAAEIARQLESAYSELAQARKGATEAGAMDSTGLALPEETAQFFRNHPGSLNADGEVQAYYTSYESANDMSRNENPGIVLHKDYMSAVETGENGVSPQAETVYAAIDRPLFASTDTLADYPETADAIRSALTGLGFNEDSIGGILAELPLSESETGELVEDVVRFAAETAHSVDPETSVANILEDIYYEMGIDGILYDDGAVVFDEDKLMSAEITDRDSFEMRDYNYAKKGKRAFALGDNQINDLLERLKAMDNEEEVPFESLPDDWRWNEVGEEYGTIEGTDIPYRVSNSGKKTSKATVGLMENEVFVPKKLLPLFRQAVLKELMGYTPISEKKGLAEAQRWLRSFASGTAFNSEEMTGADFEKAYQQWMGMAKSRSLKGSVDILKGYALQAELANAMKSMNEEDITDGQLAAFEKLTAQLALNASNAGQMLRAIRTAKQMTPQGRLYYINQMIEQLRDQLNSSKNALRRNAEGILDNYQEDEGYQKLVEELNAIEPNQKDTQARLDEVEEKIIKYIADKIPATVESRVRAWRYLCMLGNAKTHVRNISSNLAMALTKIPARELSGLMQDIGGIFSRNNASSDEKNQRTISFINRPNLLTEKGRAIWQFAKEDYAREASVLQDGGKRGFMSKIEQQRRSFGKNAVGRFFEKWSRFNGNALEAEDAFFLRQEYIVSLARYMAANNLTPEMLTREDAQSLEKLNTAREYAAKNALEATYRSANFIAELLNEGEKKGGPIATILTEGIIPFKRTPMNILKTGIRYSPIGIAEGLYDLAFAVKSGKMTAGEAVDAMCQGLTGTAISGLGYCLAAMGLVKAKGSDSDREEYYDQMLGNQEYSIRLGDTNYTLDWLTPLSMPFFAGATFFNDVKERGEDLTTIELLNWGWDAIKSVADPVTELSMLQGVSNLVDTLKEDNAPLQIATNAATSYAKQYVPTLSGQMLRFADPTRRSTYAPTDSKYLFGKGGEKFVNQLQNKSLLMNAGGIKDAVSGVMNGEGWNFDVPNNAYVDQWGREEGSSGNRVKDFFDEFIVPWYSRDYNQTAVDDKLAGIFEKSGDNQVLPKSPQSYYKIGKNYYMTGDEYEQTKKTVGRISYRGLQDAFGYPQFNRLDSNAQAKVVKEIYEYAKELAKIDYADKHSDIYVWRSDKEKSEFLEEHPDANGFVMSSDAKKIEEAEDYGLSAAKYLTIKTYLSQFKGKEKKQALRDLGLDRKQRELFE